jgi:hypothetical protein
MQLLILVLRLRGSCVIGTEKMRNVKRTGNNSRGRSLKSESQHGKSPYPNTAESPVILSEKCGDEFTVRWNKSFDPESIVYKPAANGGVHTSFESLPNEPDIAGRPEAIRDPFQREEART